MKGGDVPVQGRNVIAPGYLCELKFLTKLERGTYSVLCLRVRVRSTKDPKTDTRTEDQLENLAVPTSSMV
jgi:hypothetical protein